MRRVLLSWLAVLILPTMSATGDDDDEFRVKRAAVFEFAREPAVEFAGDEVTISFAAKAACDVTVAVEDPAGNIVRHLACGVLGPNAPEPFQKNSLEQTLTWDGKDDRGRYIDDRARHVVRVSLGLKPAFERNLLWEPRRRLGSWMGGTPFINMPAPLIQAAEDGIYVFEGRGVDQLRVFDRDGEYVRTVYPFPADRIAEVQGIDRQTYPQDSATLPHKRGFLQSTFLSSGATGQKDNREHAMYGSGATAMAVRDGRIALTLNRLNRLATDGSTVGRIADPSDGGLPLTGPEVTVPANLHHRIIERISPTRLAFSPDGEWLYLTSYQYRTHYDRRVVNDTLAGVARMRFAGDEPPRPFLGSVEFGGETGSAPGQFRHASSVDVDDQGRIYVSDYMNDRIQVFSPDGEFLKAVPTFKPALVRLHRKTGEIYAFSWTLHNYDGLGKTEETREIVVKPLLRRYGPVDDPEPRGTFVLPFQEGQTPWAHYRETFHGGVQWGGRIQRGAGFVERPAAHLARRRRAIPRALGPRAGPHLRIAAGRRTPPGPRLRRRREGVDRQVHAAAILAAAAVREPGDGQAVRRRAAHRRAGKGIPRGDRGRSRDRPHAGRAVAVRRRGHRLRTGRLGLRPRADDDRPLRIPLVAGDPVGLWRGRARRELRLQPDSPDGEPALRSADLHRDGLALRRDVRFRHGASGRFLLRDEG
ncbi:MAG: hypothetical protein WD069_09690 [Planctomycetales bacterium]